MDEHNSSDSIAAKLQSPDLHLNRSQLEEREEKFLAPWGMLAKQSRGRVYPAGRC